ncbi:MAG: DUF1080 domain-containing protein [Pirellulales bacterium]
MSRKTLLLCAIVLISLTVRIFAAQEAKPNTLNENELADGWISLFDGETLYGWEPSSKADWKVTNGVISVGAGEKGLLCTTSEFADYVFKVDFRAPAATNSGVFLRTPTVPKNPAEDCYELNIATPAVSPFPTGSFVQREKATTKSFDEDWHTFEVTAYGARWIVQLDGQPVLEYTDQKPLGRGRIGLQFNEGKVEFKNVKLKPLNLKTIFNGRDLAGWQAVEPNKSQFTVTDKGELNVKNGRGALESQQSYGDFVLQLECFSNGKHLNSGIFFRSIPGEFNNGYECQIRNEYKDGDRNQPVDFGTGGIYRRQPARRVTADDFKWFPMTLVVSGSHMAAWVNGIQVSDWTDTRKPHENPRNGLRTEAGTLQIQGHDPTTDLSFRKLRIVEMPKR